jgi:galactose-1-phosphate uridylyltransferase
MYSRITQEIFIGADMLEHAQTTIDTVIHEIAHHTSGSDDLEERHAAAMTEVAAKVVKETAGGAFDELLMEVTW